MIYGLYLAYSKWEVLPDEECADPTVPRYPASVARVRAYDNKRDQMEAYANTMCPASQTFEAETKEEFDAKVAEFKKNFEDEAWDRYYVQQLDKVFRKRPYGYSLGDDCILAVYLDNCYINNFVI